MSKCFDFFYIKYLNLNIDHAVFHLKNTWLHLLNRLEKTRTSKIDFEPRSADLKQAPTALFCWEEGERERGERGRNTDISFYI